jgi:type IV pilus assembly protein PilA
MHATLRKLREGRTDGDSGFTLIEMLVVVVIIGVLAGIAIPLYLNYRKGAENKSAESDVRGAISAVEQYYTENNAYPATQVGTEGANLNFVIAGGTTQVASVSDGNTLSYKNNGTTYVVCGVNSSGGQIWVYNSLNGRPVGKSTQTTLALCVANGN